MFKFFKPKNKQETKEPKKVSTERKYFEVFGDSLMQLDFHKTLNLVLVGFCFFSILLIKSALNKPPLVIRVDQLGETQAVRNVKSQSAVSGPEISNFTAYFLQYLTAWNAYSSETDFTRALEMSSLEYRAKLKNYLESERILERILKEKLNTKLTISEITIENDTPKIVAVKVKGFKEIRSYEEAGMFQEIIFETKLVLKKVERTTQTPWGLLVQQWDESLYKSK